MKIQVTAGTQGHSQQQGRVDAANQPVEGVLPRDVLEPMLAGAWARGVADAYELLGLGAVLLNANGLVLHASERARRMTNGVISIVSDHMVGATPEANSTIEALVAGGLSNWQTGTMMAVIDGPDGVRISARILSVPAHENRQNQLLKAVVILSVV